MLSMEPINKEITLEEFIELTGEFGFTDNQTGEFNEDGTVFYDHQGLDQYIFQNKEDAYTYLIKGESVLAKTSSYIGSRDDNENLGAECEAKGIALNDEEDGSSVWTAFTEPMKI